MDKKELKNKINREFHKIPVPDVLEKVQCQPIVVDNKETKSKGFNYRLAIGISLAIILVIAIFPIYTFATFDDTVYATVNFDINPSIAIEVNQDDKVIAVNALNEDGDKIIDRKFKRKDIEQVLEIILDNASDKGYENSVVLYGIECQDDTYKSQLRQRIEIRTNDYYRARNIHGNPIWLDDIKTDNFNEQAQHYDMPRAKLAIIYQIIDKHPEYSIEELSQMNMQQLQQLLREN